MKKECKQKKRKAIKQSYTNFVTDLKSSNSGKFYKMCKKIGADDNVNDVDLKIKSFEGLNDLQCAEGVAEYIASISNEYDPVNLADLPAYLPAGPPHRVEEHEVYKKADEPEEYQKQPAC